MGINCRFAPQGGTSRSPFGGVLCTPVTPSKYIFSAANLTEKMIVKFSYVD
jgi:hypothetical protein